MTIDISGSWKLVSWQRIAENGTITYPLGENASGSLIYTPDFKMAVQMAATDRPLISSDDALGGEADQRAAAYSTCLAYFGTYEVNAELVVHRIEASLYPNWSGTVQSRPYSYDGQELVLRTLPIEGPDGTVVNAISWVRDTTA